MKPYIYIERRSKPDARGLYLGPACDLLSLTFEDGRIETSQARTLATHTERHAAPVLAVGEQDAIWCPGTFHGRPSLVAQGRAMRWTRAGVEESGYTGLHLHSWKGRSDGCITAPDWWVRAMLMACERLIDTGEWKPPRGDDGRWMIGAHVVEV